ncbi:META domain-containing protein [Marinobacter nauticus]|uniref:META domain-containing protein n=2 Tax=Marinobacter nauticus TaxID=2743 RepID=A0A1M2UUQ8_MARNT|nr:META domain-containing protein [Marinobacter nauticus]
MSLAKNILAMLLVTGSLWGCSLSQERATGKTMNLAGSQWQVEEIDGDPVAEGSDVTIAFTDEGRVSGSSSCNRYQGGWDANGNQLELSRMAATRMACPEPLIQQENRFLKLLGDIRHYQFEADGRLVLETADGTKMTAVPQPSGKE